ncbi:MAG TPA: hypothetical protein VF753_05945 [Terriglobales bacterium]
MELSVRSPKLPSQLSDSIHRQLNMYTRAASAAGVSLAALTLPAEAKIVYTPAHENAVKGINLDLNHDGSADFRICLSTDTYHCSGTGGVRQNPQVYWDALEVKPLNAANRVFISSKGQFAAALRSGRHIGSRGKFVNPAYWMAGDICSAVCTYEGPWFNADDRYLGFKFIVDREIHYGWARLNIHWLKKEATLTGYAYETDPGKPIIAGETKGPDVITVQPDTASGSLGGLALGRQ